MLNIPTKICRKCIIEKPATEFHKNKKGCKLGLHSYCIACFRSYSESRAKTLEGRAASVRRTMAYFERNPEKKKVLKSEYYQRYQEKFRARERDRRLENGDVIRERERLNRIANPEKWKAKRHNREARKRGAGGFCTTDDRIYIRCLQLDRCAAPWCACALHGKGDFDHLVPIILGGSSWPENMQWLCHSCNLDKGRKDPQIWAAKHGYRINLETKAYERLPC